MAEYIDREALCKILENWRDAHADVDDEHGCGLLEDVICEVDAQTVVDAVEVVRCKDCYQSAVIDDVFYCTYWGKNTDENGYCHEGG